jgi:thiamine-monophosphate kinase
MSNSPEQSKRTEVAEYGEFGLIEHLTKNFEIRHGLTIKGIGDDAAVLDAAGKLQVMSTDLLLEGIHFDLMYMPLKHLGYKSVVVNVSDICAMNAVARQITFSFGMSNRFSVEALEELYEGIHLACKRYDLDLVGGDTTSSHQGLVISVTAIGEGNESSLSYRDGAQVGDLICLSGDLGGSFLGLTLLEREKKIFLENPKIQPSLDDQAYVVGRHLKPEARVDIVAQLSENEIVPTSMIDISDGLSSDLLHICHQSNCGARIEEKKVRIHQDTYQLALQFNIDPINCALNGGEDYELLFTIKPEDAEKLEKLEDVSIIGEVTEADRGVKILTKGGNEHELIAGGWNHLRPQNSMDMED